MNRSSQPSPSPPPNTPVFFDNTSAPTCKICDKGKLISKKIHKYGIMCALAGAIIAIPSIFVALIALATTLMLRGDSGDSYGGDTAAIGFAISALAFASGGLGYFLAQTKKILRCNKCGATIEAS